MKQEIHDLIVEGTKNAPVTGVGMAAGQWAVMVVGVIYGLIQIAYLVRKWWREETEWGIRLKKLLGKPTVADSQPADL